MVPILFECIMIGKQCGELPSWWRQSGDNVVNCVIDRCNEWLDVDPSQSEVRLMLSDCYAAVSMSDEAEAYEWLGEAKKWPFVLDEPAGHCRPGSLSIPIMSDIGDCLSNVRPS